MNFLRIRYIVLFCCILALFGLWSSCIESFVPDIVKYEDALVVDGNISDAPGPYTIRLSKSVRLKERPLLIPYPDCEVKITDDLGNSVTLWELEPGLYKTDSTTMRGIPGRSYKLSILTKEGDAYESTPEKLLAGIKIQSVNAELEHKSDPNLFYGRDGYQFYVDAETPATTDNYLFWRMQCTYKFRTDFNIFCYYDHGIHPVLEKDSLRTCYRNQDILDLYLLNTNELKQKEIKRVPLNYVDNYTKALSIRYSLKVSQFTLNEAAFNYWSAIKKMLDAGGELYTTQPYQVKNNLINITHPEKPVLGYFMVAGLSEKRIFVNHPAIIDRWEVCEMGDEPQKNVLQWFVNVPSAWPVFYADAGGFPYYLSQECVDCQVDGTLTKPSFWVN